MSNTVSLVFAGDSTSLERTFKGVGSGATKMAGDLDSASAKAKGFGGAMAGVGGAVSAQESKFMGAADLLDGLGGAFGLPTEAATGMMRAFGDMSGGFEVVQGVFTSGMSKIGSMFTAMKGWTIVTQAQTAAQWLLNTALNANPIGLVIAAVAALVAGFVIAYKNSETFRNIVQSAMSGVKTAVGWVVDRFSDLWDWISKLGGGIGRALSGVGDAFLSPFRWAFDRIRGLWNSTVGGFRFEIPDWIPGVGGKGFSIPRMHTGGIVPGTQGMPVPIMALAGERITPAGGGGGGGVTVYVAGSVITEQQLIDAVQTGLLRKQGRSGNLGFEAA